MLHALQRHDFTTQDKTYFDARMLHDYFAAHQRPSRGHGRAAGRCTGMASLRDATFFTSIYFMIDVRWL